MTRNLLLVGTSKGAFILDGDASRRRGRCAAPSATDGRSTTCPSTRPMARSSPPAGSAWYGPAVFRSEDLGSTWTHSSEGLTYGDDGPKIPTIWNVTGAHGSIWAGAEPAGLFRSDDRGADLVARLGPARSPEPSGLGARRRWPHLPHDRPASERCGADVGRDQRGRDVRDGRRWGDLGGAKSRGCRLLRAGSASGDGPVRPQARDGGRRARQPLPAEPLRRLPLGRRRSELGGRQRGARVGVRVRHGRASARSSHGLGDPARPIRRRAACRPTARSRCGAHAIAAIPGSATARDCRRRTRSSASCGRRSRSTEATPPASTSGRAPGSSTARSTRAPAGRSSRTISRRSGGSRPSSSD